MPVEAKPLFRPDVLRPHLLAFNWPKKLAESKATLANWATMVWTGRADKFKEQELLPDFLTDVFCSVLGYPRPADNAARYPDELLADYQLLMTDLQQTRDRLKDELFAALSSRGVSSQEGKS